MLNRQRTVHGLSVGILMMDTKFERVPGDIGNASTFPFPVQYRVVRGADEKRVIGGGAEGLLEPFIAAAQDLVDSGVNAISTSCGFLSLFQAALAERFPVPVATSSLMLVPLVKAMIAPGRQVGIMTYAAESLTDRHLTAVGVDPRTPKVGFALDSEFRKAIGGGAAVLPREAMRAETIALGRRLVRDNPDVAAIVCECSNMPPYVADVSQDLGLPVFDLTCLVRLLHAGALPGRY